MEDILVIENLSKTIKGKNVVDSISFSLEKGDILGFLGPNGAGKSTTIKMILGLVKPTEGNVKINGYNISTDREKALYNVGAMVEYPSFDEQLSGFKNLKLYANLYNLTNERVYEVLKIVNLFDDKDKKVKSYSMGMKQRLGIARAFLNNPKVVILDEPTNGLDPVCIIEIRNLIKKLAETEGVTFLICSHILGELQNICNKIAIVSKGKLIVKGDLVELLNDNEFERLEDYYLKVLEG